MTNRRQRRGLRGLETRSLLAGLCLAATAACAEPAAAPEPHPLQGHWEGEADGSPVSIDIEGDSLYFYQRDDFQYDTVFTLIPGSDPAELHATILDTPRTTDGVGDVVVAIYEFVDGALHIAAVDKPDDVPGSFDQAMSQYRLERAPARD